MTEQVAFQFGAFFTLASSICIFISWILASFYQLRIESVSILLDPYFALFKTNIKSIQLSLGWLPLGSFVKMVSTLDMTSDEDSGNNLVEDIPNHEFRGRSMITKVIISVTGNLFLVFVGYLLIEYTSSTSVLELASSYLQINFFQLPLEAGNNIWNQLYSNPKFFLGTICLHIGFFSTIRIILFVFNEKNDNCFLSLLIQFSILPFYIGALRLVWDTITFMNLFYFFVGSFFMGILGFLVALLLAKLLPNA